MEGPSTIQAWNAAASKTRYVHWPEAEIIDTGLRRASEAAAIRSNFMPKDAHITAAYHHERAAKSHRAAAIQTGKGDREACEEQAVEACEHSTRADEASKLAHQKSIRGATPVALRA